MRPTFPGAFVNHDVVDGDYGLETKLHLRPYNRIIYKGHLSLGKAFHVLGKLRDDVLNVT